MSTWVQSPREGLALHRRRSPLNPSGRKIERPVSGSNLSVAELDFMLVFERWRRLGSCDIDQIGGGTSKDPPFAGGVGNIAPRQGYSDVFWLKILKGFWGNGLERSGGACISTGTTAVSLHVICRLQLLETHYRFLQKHNGFKLVGPFAFWGDVK